MRTILTALLMTLATKVVAEGKGNAAEKAIKEWELNGGFER